jgi:hypothetical protein
MDLTDPVFIFLWILGCAALGRALRRHWRP